jgi:hypothetical protein
MSFAKQLAAHPEQREQLKARRRELLEAGFPRKRVRAIIRADEWVEHDPNGQPAFEAGRRAFLSSPWVQREAAAGRKLRAIGVEVPRLVLPSRLLMAVRRPPVAQVRSVERRPRGRRAGGRRRARASSRLDDSDPPLRVVPLERFRSDVARWLGAA